MGRGPSFARRSPLGGVPLVVLALETNGLGRVLLRQPPQTNHPLAFNLQAVPAHERLLAVVALYECPVGALVDEHKLAAVDFDPRVNARDQVALDDDVV